MSDIDSTPSEKRDVYRKVADALSTLLKADSRATFTAASKAQKACDGLIQRAAQAQSALEAAA